MTPIPHTYYFSQTAINLKKKKKTYEICKIYFIFNFYLLLSGEKRQGQYCFKSQRKNRNLESKDQLEGA